MRKRSFILIGLIFTICTCAPELSWKHMSIVEFPNMGHYPPKVVVFKTDGLEFTSWSLKQSVALQPFPISPGVWKYHIPPDFWLQMQPQFAFIIVDINISKVWLEAELFLGNVTTMLSKKMMLEVNGKKLRHLRIRGVTGWIYQFYCVDDKCDTIPKVDSSL